MRTIQKFEFLSKDIRSKEISIVEVVEYILDKITAKNNSLNCFTTIAYESAIRDAHQAQEHINKGNILSPLHGMCIVIKDNMDVAGLPTTGASNAFPEFIPDHDAPIVEQLRKMGAIIIGKTNLYELAAGGVSPKYGDVKNPWDETKSAGASSSGTACAVAAGFAHGGTGTDSGGSVRLPASVCGVVGLKPTYGLLDRKGVIPGGYDIDHVGFITSDIYGIAAMLDATVSSLNIQSVFYDNFQTTSGYLSNLRIGIPKILNENPILSELRQSIDDLIQVFERNGARITYVNIPDLSLANSILMTIHSVETAEFHRNLLQNKLYNLSPGVRSLLTSGETVKATDFVRAQRVRQVICNQMRDLFKDIDLLVTPTLPISAWPVNAEEIQIEGKTENVISAITQYTPIYNLTGQPAISIPCGFSKEKLPLGIQLACRPYEELLLLRISKYYEKALGPFQLADDNNF